MTLPLPLPTAYNWGMNNENDPWNDPLAPRKPIPLWGLVVVALAFAMILVAIAGVLWIVLPVAVDN